MKPDWLYGIVFLLFSLSLFANVRLTLHWSWGLGWPGISFLLAAIAYLTVSTPLFGKRTDGSRKWPEAVLMFPYLLLARLVWEVQIQFSRESPANLVGDSLIIARRLRPFELPGDLAAILDLTCELSDPEEVRRHAGYYCLPILDANGVCPEALIACILQFPPPSRGTVLVHCANGHGRTGLVAAAWLLSHRLAADPADALHQLKSVRPAIRLRRRQHQLLKESAKTLFSLEPFGDAIHRYLAFCLGRAMAGQQYEDGVPLPDISALIGPMLLEGDDEQVPRIFSGLIQEELETEIPYDWLASYERDDRTTVAEFLDACVTLLKSGKTVPPWRPRCLQLQPDDGGHRARAGRD